MVIHRTGYNRLYGVISKWAPKPEEQETQPPVSNTEDTDPPNANSQATASNEARPTTSLSASAPAFSPVTSPAPPLTDAPPPDVSTTDEFAQTGAVNEDLFDDVTPIDETMRVRSDDDLFTDDFTPVAQPVVEQAAPVPVPVQAQPTTDAPRRGGRGGRGRGRGDAQSRQAPKPTPQPDHQQDSNGTTPQQHQAPEFAPTGPRKDSTPAVQGDRRSTGGVRKPKLSEAELAEKMERIKLKNAELNAAHERAEADAASFAHREAEAKVKAEQRAKEERRDRQQMMGEREKNRMRKLRAQEGREWDSEKQEGDFGKGGRFDKKGGFAGDHKDYTDGREYLYREPRGGREGGGRGGRGGRDGRPAQHQPSAPPKQEDFPALPGSDKVGGEERPKVARESSGLAGRSWADQVESAS
ncbi:hypothetical protein KC319_g893 [Hortaea werneckii]|nr:hypothetical protein KC320_g4634 [Hortaea werneckii]KAI7572070.1 hypothetical protein KC317_g1094 [Hortaea werneckii]KAI7627384.1 hypothetical protein KC346_g767 [Hortaea werneckii]KAI7682652.1 hypothetical protein KC319_g893 [Hortaea werneckii]KAI7707024.1 hypothetical protein KC322_g5655 [Hortaea werneckii]